MTVTLTPTARLVALIGLLCACALGSGALLLARKHTAAASPPTSPVTRVHKQTPVGTIPPEHAVVTRHHTSLPTQTVPSVKPAPKPKPVVVDSKVPTAVASALETRPIVVAALYAPGAATDPTAVAEAQAGAQLAGAGFVKLDVLDESVANQLARVADHLSDPAVLVFRRSGLSIRIDGFADRDVVAQAAQNAAAK